MLRFIRRNSFILNSNTLTLSGVPAPPLDTVVHRRPHGRPRGWPLRKARLWRRRRARRHRGPPRSPALLGQSPSPAGRPLRWLQWLAEPQAPHAARRRSPGRTQPQGILELILGVRQRYGNTKMKVMATLKHELWIHSCLVFFMLDTW